MIDPRSIIFQAHEIRAARAGRKTQLRAPVKPQFYARASVFRHETKPTCNRGIWCDGHGVQIRCPYGAPNSLLYVRETWNGDWCDRVIYRADGGSAREAGYLKEPEWRAPATMPREAARLWLRITAVRVERLQEITEADAVAEGVDLEMYCENHCTWRGPEDDLVADEDGDYPHCPVCGSNDAVLEETPEMALARQWDAVAAAEGGLAFEENSWIWVIEFERAPKPVGP